MRDVLFLERTLVEGNSCATYLISDDKLPNSMDDVELKIKPDDLNTLRRGNTPTPDAPWIGILLGREKKAYAIDEPYLQAVLMTGARIKLIHYDNIEAQCHDIHGILLVGGFFPTPSEWYVKPSPDDELPTKRTGAYISLIQIAEKKAMPILGICGGYQLLGHYYQPFDGEKLKGISLLDAYTVAGKKRFIGNVTAKTNLVTPETLVGFENHSGLTFIQGDTKPLAVVTIGNGNNGKDKTEGAYYKNVFGTYLHGSFLPKNPHFADFLIELALEKRYGEKIQLSKLDDTIENKAHQMLVDKAY